MLSAEIAAGPTQSTASERSARYNGAPLSHVKFKYIVIAFENPGSNVA
jgi:hypothetical protein